MTGEDERIEMEIRKRNGESVPFQQEKIFNAMKKAFDGQGMEIGSRELNDILAAVLDNLAAAAPLTVERVQDEVERTLMERGHYEVAKAYILYREKRSALRRVRQDDGVALVLLHIADKQRADHDDHSQRRKNEHQQRPPVFLVLLRRPSPSFRFAFNQALKSAGFSAARPKCHKIACTMRSLAWPSP